MIKRLLIAVAMSCAVSVAQVPVTPASIPRVTFVDSDGDPCAGCSLQSFAAGTTTPLATYTDSTGVSQNTNPIILDPSGGAFIWLGGNSYKLILKDTLGSVVWSVDHVSGGQLLPCNSANAVQSANSAVNGLTCDSTITINTINHTLNIGTLPTNHVSIGALGTPTAWNLDTTSPATAWSSLTNNIVSNFSSSTYQINRGILADGVDMVALAPFVNGFENGISSFVGALETNSSSTVVEADGVLGVAVQNGGSGNAVGTRGTALCKKVGGASCWGGNFLSTDVAANSGVTTLWGIESDTNVYNTSTIGQGISITGYFDAQPAANMNAMNIFVVPKTGTNNAWNAGIAFAPGAIAGNGPAIFLAPALGTLSQPSQNITFQSEDSGGGINTAHFFLDSAGNLNLCTFSLFTGCVTANAAGDLVSPRQLQSVVATGTAPLLVNSTTPVANLINDNQPVAFAGGSSTITTATKIFSSACLTASGTCTVTIPAAIFANSPTCTLTISSGDAPGTAEPTVWLGSISHVSLVIRSSSTSIASNVGVLCFGQ